ncbi:MAG: hypothetical protein ACRC80_29405 [Waterburya sp.]
MAHAWYKHIFGEIGRLAPLMHMSELDYRTILAAEAKRDNGSLKALKLNEYLLIKDKLEADARALGKSIITSSQIDIYSETKNLSLKKGFKSWRGDKMINKIKALAYTDPIHMGLTKEQVWQSIDSFLLTHGAYKKKLNNHTYFELVKVTSQLSAKRKNNLRDYTR